MNFPEYRPRRMRRTDALRRMVRETRLATDNLVLPLFVTAGTGVANAIGSMPGQFQYSVDKATDAAAKAWDLGIPAVILFGIPDRKDAVGSEAWNNQSVVHKAIRAIKKRVPEMTVIADACFCEYTDHGHCGVLIDGDLDNDATLENLGRVAVGYAQAGADIVAPSGMLDGFVGACREALDDEECHDTIIMAYSAKYASGYYGPFQDAAHSAPKSGDRRSHQMDPANIREAMREISLDLGEGADLIMVKPALAYLDVIRAAADEVNMPLCAYSVSGEYAMIEAAAANGWINRQRVIMETLTSIRRAGADMIITYHALDAAQWLAGK